MKIVGVTQGSVGEELGIRSGDELLEINGERVRDDIDYRFHESEERLQLKVARNGEIVLYEIEKDDVETIGLTFEDMRILACGNDCVFCFVDQNPEGLRKSLYFRDGDYRLSFMYGNYTTMTNAGPAILRRIIEQRLSPQYISVHSTDQDVRRRLMGLKKDDAIVQKIRLLHDHGIEMHTQIVLCPGLNDGASLDKTVADLYCFKDRIRSLAIVPVGLTDHRFGLAELRRVDRDYAKCLLGKVAAWQKRFRKEIGRSFVYASDEFYIVGEEKIPSAASYDGFPQRENGVGLVRSFLDATRTQGRRFPERLRIKKTITLVTGELAQSFMGEVVVPTLERIKGLTVHLVVAHNLLFGRGVTVSGLLSGNCVYSSLHGRLLGDLVLLPPDILNTEGVFLDDMTPAQLGERLLIPISVFDGRWSDVLKKLQRPTREN